MCVAGFWCTQSLINSKEYIIGGREAIAMEVNLDRLEGRVTCIVAEERKRSVRGVHEGKILRGRLSEDQRRLVIFQ